VKIYVASSWREDRQPIVVAQLREAGHDVYDFRNPEEGNHGFAWSAIDPDWMSWTSSDFVEALSHPAAEEGFRLDFCAMQWCDVCLLVCPMTPGRSSHLELGWCAGAGKFSIVLLQPGQRPELMYKMADLVTPHLSAVLATLTWPGALERPISPFGPKGEVLGADGMPFPVDAIDVDLPHVKP